MLYRKADNVCLLWLDVCLPLQAPLNPHQQRQLHRRNALRVFIGSRPRKGGFLRLIAAHPKGADYGAENFGKVPI